MGRYCAENGIARKDQKFTSSWAHFPDKLSHSRATGNRSPPRPLICYEIDTGVVHAHLTISSRRNTVSGAMFSFNPRCTTRAFQNIAGLLALAGVLVSSLGILFVPATNQDSSQAFPCQGGSCGCTSAAQCWQSCCCTSLTERIVWADANDVQPPAFLFDLLAAFTEHQAANEPGTCCSGDLPQDGDSSSCVVQRDSESPGHVVLISDLNRCRGLSNYIAVFGSAVCEPLPDAVAFDFAAISWLRSLDESLESRLSSPPTPPPRIVA